LLTQFLAEGGIEKPLLRRIAHPARTQGQLTVRILAFYRSIALPPSLKIRLANLLTRLIWTKKSSRFVDRVLVEREGSQ
jgi:hypothetical protein